MDVALEELNEARQARPAATRGPTTCYGLVYACWARTPKAEENFRRALQLAPQDSEIRQNWGWYLCTQRPRARVDPRVRGRAAQPAVQDARDRADQRRQVQRGVRRRGAGRDATSAARCRRRPATRSPPTTSRSLAYKAARFDEARSWMRIVMQETNPPPEALFLGMCIERKLGRRAGRALLRLAAAQPLPGLGGDQGDQHRGLRVRPARAAKARRACRRSTEVDRHRSTPSAMPAHGPQLPPATEVGRPAMAIGTRGRRVSAQERDPPSAPAGITPDRAGTLLRTRARRPACRSTPSRSS